MYQLKSKILENINVRSNYFKLSFMAGPISKNAKPGQFIEVKVSNDLEPLLRKPFGIHKVSCQTKDRRPTPDVIEILYEVVGKGTEILSKRKAGEDLDVIGPLGNGFSCQLSVVSCQPILVGGGIGVAPLFFLAQELGNRKPKTENRKPIVLLGAKTKNAILCEREFKNLGCDVKIATDDDSRGYKGFVTDVLKNLLSTIDYRLSTIYACGPKAMLKEAANIAKTHRTPCQVLLEEYMACGVGVCLGCAVKVRTRDEGRRTLVRRSLGEGGKDEYKMVCKDGPVFKADEVIWE